MQAAIVAYPELSQHDRDWIERIREIHDPQRDVIPAHFTLVFPAEVGAATLVDHARDVVARFGRVAFVLTRAAAVGAFGGPGGHVFLVPGPGAREITSLHDALYAGPLAAHLRSDIPFVPHVTVAAHDVFEQCERVAERLNDPPPSIAGRITRLAIVESEPASVRTIATLDLRL